MKPYSLDLRKKIIETYEQEQISQRKLAKRFRVALSFIYKLLKQYREKPEFDVRKSLKIKQSKDCSNSSRSHKFSISYFIEN
ncbi:transcriptional regulator [Nostoc sphaeroides CCNUC1]|uniref:Transcriptional regulator n=1 Tax=Nostoc sphaeroides CCNUC1 TaxID=2653204 RepID=A0A5P8VR13_9NOSO|nr:transcriptional regulator [Nostoc sphaeroides CCNUC1]